MAEGSWVEDFSQFQNSTSSTGMTGRKSAGLRGSRAGPGKAESRADKIKSELKLLEWHKLANDAALKAALMQTKSLRDDAPEVKPRHVADDAKWIKKVIEEEHMKSLKVSKDYVLDYEAKEADQHDRQEAALEKHVETLGSLRERLESKVELKKSTNKYREFQRQFTKKKWAIMKGMTLEDLEAQEAAAAAGPESNGGPGGGVEQGHIPEPSDLTNVLDSLNKLARLEQRISSLEGNNEYEKMVKHNRTPAQERTSFEFKRKREIEVAGGPKNMVYTIKPQRTQFGTSSGAAGGRGSGINAVRGRRSLRDSQRGGGGGGGTFLTGGDFGGGDDEGGRSRNGGGATTRAQRARERQRALHDATPGQKAMRARLQARKAKQKEATAGSRRHNEAMEELGRRKREQGSRAKARVNANRIQRTTRGASSGVKTTNRHLADFQKAKNGFAKKRDDTRRSALNRVNTKLKGRSNADYRVGSKTAPAGRPERGSSRGPSNVSKRGTTTRRATGTAPSRRTSRTGGGEMPVVRGIGGVRALRGQRNGPSEPVRGRPPMSNNQRGDQRKGITTITF